MGALCKHGMDVLYQWCNICAAEMVVPGHTTISALRAEIAQKHRDWEIAAANMQGWRAEAGMRERERDAALATLAKVREWADNLVCLRTDWRHAARQVLAILDGDAPPPGLSSVAPSGHTWMYEDYLAKKEFEHLAAERVGRGPALNAKLVSQNKCTRRGGMTGRFDYVKYDDTAQAQQDDFKKAYCAIADKLEAMPKSRATALALTKLEEAYMWIGKAIRDDQVARQDP